MLNLACMHRALTHKEGEMNTTPHTSLTITIAALALTMLASPVLADTSKKTKKSAAHHSAAAGLPLQRDAGIVE